MKLLIFTDPIDAVSSLSHDQGWTENGKPDTHHTGRKGISFNIPAGTPQGNGCRLNIVAEGKVSIEQRGLLWLNDGVLAYPWDKNQEAAFAADDFHLTNEKICPEPEPIPIPTPDKTPINILRKIYTTGHHELVTKEGCGKFTEAGCDGLRAQSVKWGHIKKTGAQNQYHKHAVDALMLLEPYTLENGETIHEGVYDIIKNSENPAAEVAFNYKHAPQPELWHYPPSTEN